ncbi:MAG: YfhO family protein [Thermoleophilaceae bacterium]|nr:YfhO family protein [Thermoleophilaceae bacterium]
MRERATRNPTLAAALLYLVLAFVMFAPGLAPGRTLSASDYLWAATPWEAERPAGVAGLGSNQEQADAATQFQPALQATRAVLPHIPRWDPYILSGRSLLGDPQSAVFSPFSVPSYILPFWDSLAVVAALKLFVAALGAFLLARALGMRFGGSLMTGLVFGFSLWSVTWVSWPHMSVWAFLPWLCLLSERCVRRPGPLPFAGLALVVGLQFLGGHPASSLQVLGVVGLFWVGRTLLSRELRQRLAPRLLTFFAALVVGTALAAVALIPFGELLAHSSDATARADASDLLNQPARYLLGIFLHDYWGRKAGALQFGPGLEERAYYVAALPLMLGAAALVVRRSWTRIAVAAVGAAALAVATGLPPLYDLVVKLPGFDATNNGRFAVVTILCLAVLAGWGLDELTAKDAAIRRRGLVLGIAAGLLALPVVIALADREFGRDALGTALKVAWAFQDPAPGAAAVIKLASLLEWLVLGAAALVLVVLRLRGRLGAAAFVAIAVALVVLDLFKAGMGYNPAIEESNAVQPATPAIRYLQKQRPERFAALEVKKALSLAYPLPPNVAMRYRVYDVRGYVIPTEERYFELWRRAIAPGCYYLFCTQAAPLEPRALQALGLLGVSSLLQHPGDPPLEGGPPAYSGPDARVYPNPAALPRAFVVDSQEVVGGGEAALKRVTTPGFPGREVAVTEQRIEGLPEGTEAPLARGSAQILDYEAERVAVETDAGRPALLVLTDSWFPGWKATVDGEDTPVHRVDYVIRGVSVPAGRHTVEFRYEPASWRAGWIVSGLALLTILLAAAIGWRRHRAGESMHTRATTGMFEA